MRYVQITHTYIIPVPASEQDVVEPLAREGMSIMEGFMSARAGNMIDLRSDWQLLPKEYRPRQPVQEVKSESDHGPIWREEEYGPDGGNTGGDTSRTLESGQGSIEAGPDGDPGTSAG